ncbi:hypothetical protein Plhal703r1_c26g0109461 [Plasmopara halstedii]
MLDLFNYSMVSHFGEVVIKQQIFTVVGSSRLLRPLTDTLLRIQFCIDYTGEDGSIDSVSK